MSKYVTLSISINCSAISSSLAYKIRRRLFLFSPHAIFISIFVTLSFSISNICFNDVFLLVISYSFQPRLHFIPDPMEDYIDRDHEDLDVSHRLLSESRGVEYPIEDLNLFDYFQLVYIYVKRVSGPYYMLRNIFYRYNCQPENSMGCVEFLLSCGMLSAVLDGADSAPGITVQSVIKVYAEQTVVKMGVSTVITDGRHC